MECEPFAVAGALDIGIRLVNLFIAGEGGKSEFGSGGAGKGRDKQGGAEETLGTG